MIHILHETWKTVWTQFSPYARSFNAGDIHDLHAFDVAEGYLNRLWSWRRMLDEDDWRKLRQVFSNQIEKIRKGNSGVPLNAKERMLRPPRLPSGENAQAYTYLVRRKPALPTINGTKSTVEDKKALHTFRLNFVQAMIGEDVHTTRGLAKLLSDMLKLEAGKSHQLPTHMISFAIRKEFMPDSL